MASGYRQISQELLIEETRRSIKPVPLPHFQVLFSFSGTHICRRYWVSRLNSTELEFWGHDWTLLPPKTIQFKPQITTTSKEKMFRALNRGLIGFRLSRLDRENLAKSAVELAWGSLVTYMSPSNNQLNLHIKFSVVRTKVSDHIYPVIQEPMEVSDHIYPVIQEPMESAGPTMIPTSQASIESLKSKIIDSLDENGVSCSICLEDLKVGCEGVCMPCSHMFHGDCIKRWLRTSHYCPVCRFQMPT